MLPSQLASAGAASFAITDIEGFAKSFEIFFGQDDPMAVAARSLGIDAPKYSAKSIAAVPSAFTYGTLSLLPDTAANGGLIQWPGINPDSLRKIVRENIAPQMIIGMRIDDVLRYSQLSDQNWRPGWKIEPVQQTAEHSEDERKQILEAIRFIQQSNIETTYSQVRQRDAQRLTGFQKFLSLIVRDSMTYDAIALWTDMDMGGKVKAYTALPGGNIRLATKSGYMNDPRKFACAVDTGGRVIQSFTRDELTFYVRNPRTDPDVFGYGYSEVEMGVRVVSAFQNAFELNASTFDKSAIANGIMTISGGTVTQKQIDYMTRLFSNMKKGISKAWALPVVGLSGQSKIEIIDLTRLKGNDVYYKEFMNMLVGALCVLWRFPVARLGYKISGMHKDSDPAPDPTPSKMDEADPGLPSLLIHIECLLNEYVIQTRWPGLRFRFCGKSPAEDTREFEARSMAQTWKESRKQANLQPLTSIAPPWLKKFAEVLELSPNDANRSGAFQSVASSFLKSTMEGGDGKDSEQAGSLMPHGGDPARKLSHGRTSGAVHRDSAKETSSEDK